MSRERRWWAIAHAPILLVAWYNFVFIRNHFYVRGAFLHDAGWFSYTVYRQGLMPMSPVLVVDDPPYYWGWHVSPLVSAGSALSYLFPLDRVDWYCVFQAAVFAPLALAVPALVPRAERTSMRSALLVAAASIAFSFGGQVIACLGYPHFEAFSSAGIALMLAGLATSRVRLAWVGLALSIATREDGGLHAATLAGAVVASDLLGRPFPVPRKKVIVMMAVGLGATALAVVVQKKLFQSVNAWEHYLVGKPPYAHLSWSLLGERAKNIGLHAGHIWAPFAMTLVIAAARRDPRYLLGWVATLPWFLLNYTAKQDIKGELAIYTGFPFIGSAFWVGAYGRVHDVNIVRAGRAWPVIAAGGVSLASALGLFWSGPHEPVSLAMEGLVPRDRNPEGLRALARYLRSRERGSVVMDRAMMSWAVESGLKARYASDEVKDAKKPVASEDVSFFVDGDMLGLLVAPPARRCGHVPRTSAFYCTTPDGPLPDMLVPSSPMVAGLMLAGPHLRRDGEVLVFEPSNDSASFGPFMRLEAGAYVATWTVAFDAGCAPPPGVPAMRVDILYTVEGDIRIVAAREGSPAEPVFELPFDVPEAAAARRWELRTLSGACGFTLKDLTVRRAQR